MTLGIKGIDAISRVFSIFHDGVISRFQRADSSINLTIEIAYLARHIDEHFDRFLLSVEGLTDADFTTRPRDLAATPQRLTKLEEIFKPELEVVSCTISGHRVLLDLNQHAASCEHCGGEFTFAADSMIVTDQAMRSYTLEDLNQLYSRYWKV